MPTHVNPLDCRLFPAERLKVLERDSGVLQPSRATRARISKALACLRTSISSRRSDARTNIRACLTASRRCIFASPALLRSRLTRALQCKRRKQPVESVSSSSTSCSEVACEAQPETRHYRGAVSPANLVAVGRKLGEPDRPNASRGKASRHDRSFSLRLFHAFRAARLFAHFQP